MSLLATLQAFHRQEANNVSRLKLGDSKPNGATGDAQVDTCDLKAGLNLHGSKEGIVQKRQLCGGLRLCLLCWCCLLRSVHAAEGQANEQTRRGCVFMQGG